MRMLKLPMYTFVSVTILTLLLISPSVIINETFMLREYSSESKLDCKSVLQENNQLTNNTSSEATNNSSRSNRNDSVFNPEPFDGSTLRQSFVDKYCDLQGEPWLPDTPDKSWQYRAPYFVVPGVKKAGSTAITHYLSQHPNVGGQRTKELRTFMYGNIGGFLDNETGKILVKDMRNFMYEHDYNANMLKNNPTMVAYDGTPGYLSFSSTVPYRLLCVAPWIKLVVILREPVDRLYSQYNYNFALYKDRTNVPTFEQWVNSYMKKIERFGVIRDWNKVNFSTFAGSMNEDKAWATYLEHEKEAPVTKSMYEIQIRHWFRAFEELGRDPLESFIFLKNEELRKNATQEYHRALDFLGLPKHTLQRYKETVKGSYSKPIAEATKYRLKNFYDKYNQRLYKLLGQKWEDWDGYWDKEKKQSTGSS